ncbi:hypothetical protein [Oceanobacillus alkalisoli]|uniref:hypothetical protein n=1 Tax=Oceanobacillus alkalisoli TaxID=2925113 RepID=UPI001EE47024|nr:hypothetical protein [Oceanobacillus alkalisoli]MCG5102420.1 hypothetical protein [Oceanobacillus alkalisoli]
MAFVQDLATYIPIITFIGSIIFLFIKLLNRSKIEILLEDKFKKQLYYFTETLILSVVMAFSITATSTIEESLPHALNNFLLNLLPLAASIFFIAISLFLILVSICPFMINKGVNSQFLFNINKYSSISLFILLIFIHISFNLTGNLTYRDWETLIFISLPFAFFYLILIWLMTYIKNQLASNALTLYKVRMIKDEINNELKNLLFLYALGKEKLVFIERKDASERDVNKLTVFYIYDINNSLLMRFESHESLPKE